MEQLSALWLSLDTRRRITVILATLAVFASVLGLARIATTPSTALLFSGLDGATAGEVVSILEQRDVDYSVRGSAIYVPAAKRDELRLSLAAEGLPATGAAGYELLDNLSGFATTSQMFDAAYWRAMEGELARTILANPSIRVARVHIGRTTSAGLRRQEPRTASVTVTAGNGQINAELAKALKFLVGSAVTGLSPDNVSVIDGQSGRVFTAEVTEPGSPTTDDRASALKLNVQRLLEARVGAGNVVVEVAVDTLLESELITERTLDPNTRIAISTETEEKSLDAVEPTPAVTVASNLPTGDAAAGTAGRSQNTQTIERTNYEVSETQRELTRAPGSIRRITVAVLVDAVEVVDANGQLVRQPRNDEEIQFLKELAASAAGIDEARGDVVTIHSMSFEPLPEVGTEAAPGFFQTLNIDVNAIMKLAVLALVVLALGFGVVRPIAAQAAALPPPVRSLAAPLAGSELPVLHGEIDDTTMPAAAPTLAVNAPGLTPGGDGPAEDPVDRLKQLIADRQDETVDILRGWMETDEEEA